MGGPVVFVGARLFVLPTTLSASLAARSPNSAWGSAPSNKNWLTWLLKAVTSGPDSAAEAGSVGEVATEFEDLAVEDRVLAIARERFNRIVLKLEWMHSDSLSHYLYWIRYGSV